MTDTRIKAVATLSMYDMSRDMSRGHMDYYTAEQRMKIKQYLSEQRWRDAESGAYALGNHEIGFDEAGNPLTAAMEVPEPATPAQSTLCPPGRPPCRCPSETSR